MPHISCTSEITGGAETARTYIQKDGRVQCQICMKTFAGHSGLRQHMQFHTGRFDYWCEVCRKGFTCKSNFDRHNVKHEGVDFPCNRCSKRFKTQFSLKKHLLSDHGR